MERQQKARPRRQASSAGRSEQTSPARIIVPAALAICLLLVLVTFATAGKPGKGGGEQPAEPAAAKQGKQNSETRNTAASASESSDGESGEPSSDATGPALYKVKPGDSLGAISEKTGVETSDLTDLNPDVDPRALQPGQQLKLR